MWPARWLAPTERAPGKHASTRRERIGHDATISPHWWASVAHGATRTATSSYQVIKPLAPQNGRPIQGVGRRLAYCPPTSIMRNMTLFCRVSKVYLLNTKAKSQNQARHKAHKHRWVVESDAGVLFARLAGGRWQVARGRWRSAVEGR